MASSVFFKFKSQKEPSRVTFDGTGISVFELKREIISISRLGDGTDFDLLIYNEDSSEEYDDDTVLIPRSTSVVARRLPAARPGQGRAARYVSGRMPVSSRNYNRTEPSQPASTASGHATYSGTSGKPQSEEEKIEAMFRAESDDWERQKQQMATAQQPAFKPSFKGGKSQQVPDHPPPNGYICYRCGEKGHWIQACPTNNDPTFEGRPRVKRTTGIPRSMLQTVEKPTASSGDGTTEEGHQPAGVMVNADGEFVVALTDTASWEQYQAKAQASAKDATAAAAGSQELRERGLECPIDKRLFVDPMKSPCCGKTFCNECIENALLNSDLVCPECGTDGVLLDNLTPDEEVIAKIKIYEEEKKAEKKAAEKARSASPAAADATVSTESATADAKDVQASPNNGAASPQDAAAATPASVQDEATKSDSGSRPSSSSGRKRKAEEELPNDRNGSAPPASPNSKSVSMQRTASAQSSEAKQNGSPSSPKPPSAPKAMQKQQEQREQAMIANGFDPEFVRQMNQMAQQAGMDPSTNNNMMGFGGMPFNPMAMGMNPMMMNPAMMNQMMMQGFGGMMNGMNMNGMMGGTNQMNGMNYNQHQQAFNNGGGTYPQGPQAGRNWQQQQQNNYRFQGQRQQFGNQEDENPYMRQPVNPHRNARQKKARPVDYREL